MTACAVSTAENERFVFQELLGTGAFCKVFRALDKESQEEIAVKIIKRKRVSASDFERTKQEAHLLKQLEHPNIIKYKDFSEIKGKGYLAMELIQYGTLSKVIKQRKLQNQAFTDSESSFIMKNILEALAYLNDRGIYHRDMKPDNILCHESLSQDSQVKVIDFGLSAKSSLFAQLEDNCGTLIYMPPEQAYKQEYSKKVDVFAGGIIMYELLTMGGHPLYIYGEDNAAKYREKLKVVKRLQPHHNFSPLASNFFQNLVQVEPLKRYTAREALKHPWITRQNCNSIPFTSFDHMNYNMQKDSIKEKILTVLFLSIVKNNVIGGMTDLATYKETISRVSQKIDSWHEKLQKRRQTSFKNDADFIVVDKSPSRFNQSENSSSESNRSSKHTELLESFRASGDNSPKTRNQQPEPVISSKKLPQKSLSFNKQYRRKLNFIDSNSFHMNIHQVMDPDNEASPEKQIGAAKGRKSIGQGSSLLQKSSTRRDSDAYKLKRRDTTGGVESNFYSDLSSPSTAIQQQRRKSKKPKDDLSHSMIQSETQKTFTTEIGKRDQVFFNSSTILDEGPSLSPVKGQNQNTHRKLKSSSQNKNLKSASRTRPSETQIGFNSRQPVPAIDRMKSMEKTMHSKFIFKTNFLKQNPQLSSNGQFSRTKMPGINRNLMMAENKKVQKSALQSQAQANSQIDLQAKKCVIVEGTQLRPQTNQKRLNSAYNSLDVRETPTRNKSFMQQRQNRLGSEIIDPGFASQNFSVIEGDELFARQTSYPVKENNKKKARGDSNVSIVSQLLFNGKDNEKQKNQVPIDSLNYLQINIFQQNQFIGLPQQQKKPSQQQHARSSSYNGTKNDSFAFYPASTSKKQLQKVQIQQQQQKQIQQLLSDVSQYQKTQNNETQRTSVEQNFIGSKGRKIAKKSASFKKATALRQTNLDADFEVKLEMMNSQNGVQNYKRKKKPLFAPGGGGRFTRQPRKQHQAFEDGGREQEMEVYQQQ